MDQRGSGRSKPRGETVGNTLLNIISDCESLRCQLGIEHWDTILGGSWGSTVAVAYAQEYPHVIQSVILRGVCLFRAEEVDWMFSNAGYALEDPDGWKNFSTVVYDGKDKDELPRDVLGRYYDRLLGDDPILRLQAAKAWMRYEMSVFSSSSKSTVNDISDFAIAVLKSNEWSYQDSDGNIVKMDSQKLGEPLPDAVHELRRKLPLVPDQSKGQGVFSAIRDISPTPASLVVTDNMTAVEAAAFVPAQNMLTCFFSVNREFVMGGVDLLDPARMKRIQHIPCVAVHGGRDNVCPVNSALDLAARWSNMELRIPMASGHSMYDPSNIHEVVRATDKMAQQWLTSNRALVHDR